MRWRDRAATLLAAGALAIVLVATAGGGGAPHEARAASPDATTGAGGGDPRSEGEGPGLVGDPLFAIGAVVLLGLLAVGGTLLYVRMTPRRPGPRQG